MALTSSDIMGSQSEPPLGFRPQAQEEQTGPDPPWTGSSHPLRLQEVQSGGCGFLSWPLPASFGLSWTWVQILPSLAVSWLYDLEQLCVCVSLSFPLCELGAIFEEDIGMLLWSAWYMAFRTWDWGRLPSMHPWTRTAALVPLEEWDGAVPACLSPAPSWPPVPPPPPRCAWGSDLSCVVVSRPPLPQSPSPVPQSTHHAH